MPKQERGSHKSDQEMIAEEGMITEEESRREYEYLKKRIDREIITKDIPEMAKKLGLPEGSGIREIINRLEELAKIQEKKGEE
jgi:ubiquinone/menaquinone biosynthesis C-methylase UbiE